MILRMRDASYSSRGMTIVPPTTLDVNAGERVTRRVSDAREAEIIAMMAAALVRPTRGNVLIGEYDPRVQAVHCKLLAGFVPHDPLPLREMGFQRYIEYRAALWDIDRERALALAELLASRLRSLHEAFAYPLVGALVANPQILVLDRPQPDAREAIYAAAGSCAIFETELA
jgi:hypothetical protein